MFDLGEILPWTVKLLMMLIAMFFSRDESAAKADQIQILVLGDIGRSPRMQYHALSLAKQGHSVDLIGYQDSALHPEIVASDKIHIYPLTPFPDTLQTKNKKLFVLYGPLKVLFQIYTLLWVLGCKTQTSKWMLVQNPPSIPTLFVAFVICIVRGPNMIIDWHNFGYSILALKLGKTHPLVRISRIYELVFARCASYHFCVTDAMARLLKQDYGIKAPIMTLHDRPAVIFQPLDVTQRLAFLDKLPGLLMPANNEFQSEWRKRELWKMRETIDLVKAGKTRLIVSATSWTPDEDMSILYDSLIGYSKRAQQNTGDTTKILALITGKGPQRADFEARIQESTSSSMLDFTMIKTAYFDDLEDYAKVLASADLGVSLHTSSSGVDLPMKVVDMFGAGLPVAGWGNFEAWPELVKENVNGRSFKDARDLENILSTLLGGNPKMLQKLKAGAINEGKRRWDDEWNAVAGKFFEL